MRARRVLIPVLICLFAWSVGLPRALEPDQGAGAPPDVEDRVEKPRHLVVVDASAHGVLRSNAVPVIWKGADFFVAEWTDDQLLWAQGEALDFEVVAFDLDARHDIYLFELEDEAEPPAEWMEGALFHRGRKWVVAAETAVAAEWGDHAHAVLLGREPRAWAAPRGTPTFDCSFDPLVFGMLSQMDEPRWRDWIEKLSGVQDVTIDGQEYTIETRYSPAMSSGATGARGFDFVVEQAEDFGFEGANLEIDPYAGLGDTWENLVLTIPGQTLPGEVVLLTAHLDSISGTPSTLAPGADDNGTGSAALLEAARLMRQYRFERTIQIVWFTGEELGLIGSEAFVVDHPAATFQGAVNIDMIGYDDDGDRCFEMHVGTLPESDAVGTCFQSSIQKYGLNLPHDYLTTGATDRSDHASFWQVDVGAIAVVENFFSDGLPGGCVGSDRNPFYHTGSDTMANLAPGFGFSIAQAALATVAKMAVPTGRCFDTSPVLTATPGPGSVDLLWNGVPGAAGYRVLRSTQGCDGQWVELGETTTTDWIDGAADGGEAYYYEIEALDVDGFCVSSASNCESAVALAGSPGEPGTLTVNRTPTGDLELDWSAPDASCQASAYALYRGDLNDLRTTGYVHDTALACSTGSTTLTIAGAAPELGDADYFLVVAENGVEEGSYGRSSNDTERPASLAACRPTQDLTDCSP